MISKTKIKSIAKKTHHYSKGPFWFLVGFLIAGITLISIGIIVFSNVFRDKVIPGVYMDGTNLSGMSREEIEFMYNAKNDAIKNTKFTFYFEDLYATASAHDLEIGYDTNLIAQQALTLGKSSNILTNVYLVISSYLYGTKLSTPKTFNSEKFASMIKPLQEKAYKAPVNAQFEFSNGRVTTFKSSVDGIQLDVAKAQQYIEDSIIKTLKSGSVQEFTFEIPSIRLEPDITTEEANTFGIVEEIGSGTSLFQHSIPNRIHNVKHAASKINGILVAPNEEFSFVQHLGEVSKSTGYATAYVIQGGRTVLGDGGGVCQVSTTLFRAILDAGLPITERKAHAYRVSYYEQDSPPGFDATVYYPTVDLKFVNDTGNYLLIQSELDPVELRLTYKIYGKSDGRTVEITKPIVGGYAPAPEPLYQEDPTLPTGTTKQVDYAASGATATFQRIVRDKEGKVMIDEKYVSKYSPWRAVFLVGTG